MILPKFSVCNCVGPKPGRNTNKNKIFWSKSSFSLLVQKFWESQEKTLGAARLYRLRFFELLLVVWRVGVTHNVLTWWISTGIRPLKTIVTYLNQQERSLCLFVTWGNSALFCLNLKARSRWLASTKHLKVGKTSKNIHNLLEIQIWSSASFCRLRSEPVFLMRETPFGAHRADGLGCFRAHHDGIFRVGRPWLWEGAVLSPRGCRSAEIFRFLMWKNVLFVFLRSVIGGRRSNCLE